MAAKFGSHVWSVARRLGDQSGCLWVGNRNRETDRDCDSSLDSTDESVARHDGPLSA